MQLTEANCKDIELLNTKTKFLDKEEPFVYKAPWDDGLGHSHLVLRAGDAFVYKEAQGEVYTTEKLALERNFEVLRTDGPQKSAVNVSAIGLKPAAAVSVSVGGLKPVTLSVSAGGLNQVSAAGTEAQVDATAAIQLAEAAEGEQEEGSEKEFHRRKIVDQAASDAARYLAVQKEAARQRVAGAATAPLPRPPSPALSPVRKAARDAARQAAMDKMAAFQEEVDTPPPTGGLTHEEKEQRLSKIFDAMDTDNNGNLDLDELRKCLGPDRAAIALGDMDLNNDNKISRIEFYNCIISMLYTQVRPSNCSFRESTILHECKTPMHNWGFHCQQKALEHTHPRHSANSCCAQHLVSSMREKRRESL